MNDLDQDEIGERVSECLRTIGNLFQEGAGGIMPDQPIFVFPGDSMGVRALLSAVDALVPSVGEMREGMYRLAGAMRIARVQAPAGEPVALSDALALCGECRFALAMAQELALDSDGLVSDEMLLNIEAAVFVVELSMRLVAGAMLGE